MNPNGRGAVVASDAMRHIIHLDEGISYRRGCGYCDMTAAKGVRNVSQVWFREAQASGKKEIRIGESI